MDQSEPKTIYRMSYEEVEVRPDGSETVVRRMMDQIHDDNDPSDDIGCLIGLIINPICNCDEPSEEFVEVRRLKEARRKQGGDA